MRAQTRYRPAARGPPGPLDLQLPVVTARVPEPGSAHRVDPRGGQCAVVRVHGVREPGQNQRPGSVQQQRLLAARPSGQNRSRKDAVDAEHPGGHDRVRARAQPRERVGTGTSGNCAQNFKKFRQEATCGLDRVRTSLEKGPSQNGSEPGPYGSESSQNGSKPAGF